MWEGKGTHPDAPADFDLDMANAEPDGLEELSPTARHLWALGASRLLAKLKDRDNA